MRPRRYTPTIFLVAALTLPPALPVPAAQEDPATYIRVVSEPAGAELTVDGAATGSDPTAWLSPEFGDHLIRVERRGYEPLRLLVRRVRDGWLWGRIETDGAMGMAVDFTTEAVAAGTPGEVRVLLRAPGETAGASDAHGALVLLGPGDVDRPPPGTVRLLSSGRPCPALN